MLFGVQGRTQIPNVTTISKMFVSLNPVCRSILCFTVSIICKFCFCCCIYVLVHVSSLITAPCTHTTVPWQASFKTMNAPKSLWKVHSRLRSKKKHTLIKGPSQLEMHNAAVRVYCYLQLQPEGEDAAGQSSSSSPGSCQAPAQLWAAGQLAASQRKSLLSALLKGTNHVIIQQEVDLCILKPSELVLCPCVFPLFLRLTPASYNSLPFCLISFRSPPHHPLPLFLPLSFLSPSPSVLSFK